MKNTLSPARKCLRQVLYALLFLSFLFAGTATTTYALVRTKTISIRDITPALFELDIAAHRLHALVQTEEEQYRSAFRLIKNSFFSLQYLEPGKAMMRDLAYRQYPPAQYIHANLIMLDTPDTAERGEAMMFYQDAADEGYQPAQERLAEIARLEPLGNNGF